jgi:hypothetical protein
VLNNIKFANKKAWKEALKRLKKFGEEIKEVW